MSYYSGQGRLYLAERNTDGTPKGFLPVGNVPKLEISIETTKFEHKESMSGSRAVDYSLVQEKKGSFTMTVEDITLRNLAVAFWGAEGSQSAGTFNNLLLKASVHASLDMRVPILKSSTGEAYANVDTLVLTDDTVPTTTYEFGTSDSDTTNSLNGYVDEANGTIVIYSTAKQTSRGASATITDGQDLYVLSGNYGATDYMNAFTESSMERWLRFEGLNTVIDTSTGASNVVIVDIFKGSIDPLTGYGLINEELGSFDLTGSMLYDSLQPGTSKFFRQINVQ